MRHTSSWPLAVSLTVESIDHYRRPWRAEHSLLNTSGFVSCPEFFTLPGMAKDQYIYHAMGVISASFLFWDLGLRFSGHLRNVRADRRPTHSARLTRSG